MNKHEPCIYNSSITKIEKYRSDLKSKEVYIYMRAERRCERDKEEEEATLQSDFNTRLFE